MTRTSLFQSVRWTHHHFLLDLFELLSETEYGQRATGTGVGSYFVCYRRYIQVHTPLMGSVKRQNRPRLDIE
jgi:hypothetical protein